MSASLARACRSEGAPSPGRPGPLLSAMAAAVFPFDSVLAGMVAAGLGLEAICLYLSLSRAVLDDSLVRLGLPTPHDRPLRRPGYRGWSTTDIIRLIAWRVAGIHPETIGARLGGRSAAAVRAKCRRLGIPAPPRNLLHRLDPVTLVDPTPGFSTPVFVHAAKPDEQIKHPSATATCGTAAGAATWASPGAALRTVDAPEPELPPPPAAPDPEVAAPTPQPAPNELRLAIESARAAKRPIQKDPKVAMALILRFFSGQHYKAIAKDMGMTASQLASHRTRFEIPSDPDRSKLRDIYNEEVGRANYERLGLVLKTCIKTGNVFFASADEKGTKYSRPVRFGLRLLTEYDKHKRWLVSLIIPSPVPGK